MTFDEAMEKLKEAAANELAGLDRHALNIAAANCGAEVIDTMSDDEVRDACFATLDKSSLDELNRDQLVMLGQAIGEELKGNEVTIRKQLKTLLGLASDKDAAPAEASKKTIESWADEKRLASWQVAGAMRANKWASGKLLTEEELQKGLEALNRPMGGH